MGYGAESGDTLRLRDGEADRFFCIPDTRPQIEADPFDAPEGCSSFLRISPRFHTVRPSRRGAVSRRARCVDLLPRPCRGPIRLVARTGGTLLARASYDVPPGTKRSIRLLLTARGKAALRRSRRVSFVVVIRSVDFLFLFPEAAIGRGALLR